MLHVTMCPAGGCDWTLFCTEDSVQGDVCATCSVPALKGMVEGEGAHGPFIKKCVVQSEYTPRDEHLRSIHYAFV